MTPADFIRAAAEKLRPLKDKWVSPFSFLVAVAVHLLIISMGTTHYTGASSHPERSNQAVRKLDAAIRNKGVRFVYVKDVPEAKDPSRPPAPGAPLSDRDRSGSSPDAGKGNSWDPRSEGNSPYRQSGPAAPRYAPQARPGGPFESRGSGGTRPSPDQGSSAAGVGSSAKKAAENESARGTGERSAPSGVKVRASDKGLPIGGEENGTETAKKASAGDARVPGLSSQLGEIMVQSLQGGYHNPNASRLNQGAVSFETSGWDLGPYARIVQEKVESNWRTPAVQEILRQKGWVAIHFDITKEGKVENIEVVRTSRIPSYDRAAFNALLTSSPLPPLPEQVTLPKISGTFRFFYNMWSEEEDTP